MCTVKVRREHEPHDPTTSLANKALAAIAPLPAGMRCIVLVTDGERGGGMSCEGYDDDTARIVADLISHCRAVLQSVGKDLKLL
jgi:hypothetical protein